MSVLDELDSLQDFAEEAGKLGFSYETASGTRVMRFGDELVIGKEFEGEVHRIALDDIAEVYESKNGIKVKNGVIEYLMGRSVGVAEIVVKVKVGGGGDVRFGCRDGFVDSMITDIVTGQAL